MFSFKNDYSETAHPRILKMLADTSLIQTDGYSQDPYTAEAIALIRKKLEDETVDIHIIPGGTQTNVIAISAFLRAHEAVISVESGHINCHETGSIEATGHKVLTAPAADGKLTVDLIRQVYEANQEEHTPRPRLVYISNSTELGTIYTKGELSAIYDYCKAHGMYLFMDGARIGSALCCKGNDLTFPDLPRLCDAFYIGGTKNGAMIGEALVLCNDELKKDFRWHIKQKGAMLAKGKVWASSSAASSRMTCTWSWPATPTPWPTSCGRASPRQATPSWWILPPTSCSPSSLTTCSRNWKRIMG